MSKCINLILIGLDQTKSKIKGKLIPSRLYDKFRLVFRIFIVPKKSIGTLKMEKV